MKRVLSRMLVASGLLLGASALSTASFAAEGAAGPAKPDAAKVASCSTRETPRAASCLCLLSWRGGQQHHPGEPQPGRATPRIPRQAADRLPGQAGRQVARAQWRRRQSDPMTAMAQNLTPADMQNIALYLAQPLKQPATAGQEKLVDLGQKIWRRFARTQRAGLRGMPFCQWRRTSRPIPPSVGPVPDVHRRAAQAVPQRRPRE